MKKRVKQRPGCSSSERGWLRRAVLFAALLALNTSIAQEATHRPKSQSAPAPVTTTPHQFLLANQVPTANTDAPHHAVTGTPNDIKPAIIASIMPSTEAALGRVKPLIEMPSKEFPLHDPSLSNIRPVEMLVDGGMIESNPPDPNETELLALPQGAWPGSSYPPNSQGHGSFAYQLDPYRARAGELPVTVTANADTEESGIRLDLWWNIPVTQPLGLSGEAMPVDVDGLTQTALATSPYIQSILTEPQIRRNDLVIAEAEFDSLAFIEAKFADSNDPIGSSLTTGDNSTRFRDETFSSAAGIRKKARAGGALEVVQRGGFQENNSTFLIPNPQGTTRLEMNFTQPLMKNHGRAVNNTRVLLAQIDVQIVTNEIRNDLEDHLTDLTVAYWELFQARAEWLQRNRLLDRATKLHDVLLARGEFDSQQRQILRAEVAVASRRSDLVRAATRIRNAQARLRMLTGDPRLIAMSQLELLPQEQPLMTAIHLSMRDATITALDNRADIAKSIREIQAISARVGAAKNEVLPRLDLILSSYVAGLDGRRDTFGSFINQFSDGRPSYAAGLLFEIPIGNRASRARLARSRWEMTRALYEFAQTTEVTFTEVEIAVRETNTAYEEILAKTQAADAAQREVDYLQQRWELLPDPNESAVLLIEDLLDAQERLADEERAVVRAQVAYALSWVRLRKSMGILVRLDSVNGVPHMVSDADQGWELR